LAQRWALAVDKGGGWDRENSERRGRNQRWCGRLHSDPGCARREEMADGRAVRVSSAQITLVWAGSI
jgi:hypothetical protein